MKAYFCLNAIKTNKHNKSKGERLMPDYFTFNWDIKKQIMGTSKVKLR